MGSPFFLTLNSRDQATPLIIKLPVHSRLRYHHQHRVAFLQIFAAQRLANTHLTAANSARYPLSRGNPTGTAAPHMHRALNRIVAQSGYVRVHNKISHFSRWSPIRTRLFARQTRCLYRCTSDTLRTLHLSAISISYLARDAQQIYTGCLCSRFLRNIHALFDHSFRLFQLAARATLRSQVASE